MAQRITTEEIQTLLQKKSGVANKRRVMILKQETLHLPIAMQVLCLTVAVLLRWFKVPVWPIRFYIQTPTTWHRVFLPLRRLLPTNLIQEVTRVVAAGILQEVDCKVLNNQHLKEIHSEETSGLPLVLAAPVILHREIVGEGAKRRLLLQHKRRILNFACSLT